MAGGKIVIRPPAGSTFKSQDTSIMGNTCLYGATGGYLYAAGRAGERFAVRNSGAHVVVEGSGDHCCEYMTGGCVTILGESGVNFGAGMTGGFAYVYDQTKSFDKKYNAELIDIQRINRGSPHVQQLRGIIETYVEETNSAWGQYLLANFERTIKQFWLVKPKAISVEQLLEETSVEAAVA